MCWHLFVLYLMFSAALAAKPLKVFILAGQSNIIGHGSLDHLDQLVGTKCSEYRQALWNEESQNYIHIDSVYVKYGDSKGRLEVGKSKGFAEYDDRFGPEVMFGWTLSQALSSDDGSNVLLIKTAWGGKNLAVDFRSPTAGTNTSEYIGRRPIEYGRFYRLMINEILSALEGLESQDTIPYDKYDGYELGGFVWLHGWNDMLHWNTVEAYDKLLTTFIRDVRLDLSAPELPVVVGELGMHGSNLPEHAKDRILAFRSKQEAVTRRKEFRDNTIFVRTAPYAIQVEKVEIDTVYDRVEHYYGRADTFYHIGKALALGTLKMMNIETDFASIQTKGGCEDGGDSGEEGRLPEETTTDSSIREEGQQQERERDWVYIDGYDAITQGKDEEDDRLFKSEGQPASSADLAMREEGRPEEKKRDWIAEEWDGYDIDDHKTYEDKTDDGSFEGEGQPASPAIESGEKENIFHRNKVNREKTRQKRGERHKPYLRSQRGKDSYTATLVIIRAPPEKGFRFG